MNLGYVAAAAVIITLVLVGAYTLLWHGSGAGAHAQNGTKYRQLFCLDASNNASAMRMAISNGITCFRTDISLNQGEMNFVSNVTKGGGHYLGILDYDTVGASVPCQAGCAWNLTTWNESVRRAIADYPEIQTWEVYNEPLIPEFMGGYDNGSALDYFNMVKSAYIIIKAREPNATVVCFGGAQMFPISTVQKEYAFYQQVWSYGAAQYCDAISLHAYSDPFWNFTQQPYQGYTLAWVYNYTLGAYENLTGKPVWITETGITSNDWFPGLNYSAQKQASYLTQDMGLLASHSFVKRVYWFHLVGLNGKGGDYGLLNSTTLAPKPAWYSFLHFVDNSTGKNVT